VRITVDTNILVRAIIADDPIQTKIAQRVLVEGELVALSLHALCEFCWVARQGYGRENDSIAAAIRQLLEAGNVVVDRPAVDAGLALLDAGGDFADGVIAYTGRWLGGDEFLSFDKRAVKLLSATGAAASIPC
jgi:predicted nucleic-acid-binding protein